MKVRKPKYQYIILTYDSESNRPSVWEVCNYKQMLRIMGWLPIDILYNNYCDPLDEPDEIGYGITRGYKDHTNSDIVKRVDIFHFGTLLAWVEAHKLEVIE